MKDTTIKASGAIFIGGKSSRFGSDKAHLEFAGEILSIRIYQQLNQILDSVFFISDRMDKSVTDDLPVFVDIRSGVGPLAGLLTALKNSPHPWCFITGCDMPFFNPQLVTYLWQFAGQDQDIIVPVWDQKIEPLSAFYHTRCIPAILNALDQNQFMLKGFWQNLNVTKVDLTKSHSHRDLRRIFFNINTPDALAEAQKLARKDDRS